MLSCTSVRNWDILVQSRGSTGSPHSGWMEWILPISAAINLQRKTSSQMSLADAVVAQTSIISRNKPPFPFSTLISSPFQKLEFMTFRLLECWFFRHLSGDRKLSEYFPHADGGD